MFKRASTLYLFSLIYNFSLLKGKLYYYDEGLILAGAERITKGQLPYIDFWSIYPPGQFYTVALFFELFGASIFVERVYDIIIRSLIPVFIFIIIKNLNFSKKIAYFCWGMALIWSSYSGFPAYPVHTALLFIFISILCFLTYLSSKKNLWLFLAAAFMGLSALFRHDLAAMATAATLTTLFINIKKEKNSFWPPIVYFMGGYLLVGLPVTVYFVNAIGLQTFIDYLIILPAEIIPKYRAVPYPSILDFELQFFIFPLILLGAFLISLKAIFREKSQKYSSYTVFQLGLMGILFMNQVRVRSDNIHLLPVALVSITTIPAWFSFLKSYQKRLRPTAQKLSALIYGLVICLVFIVPIVEKVLSINKDYFKLHANQTVPAATYITIPNDLENLAIYLQSITSENESIYVGVKNHDQFIANDVIIYFLSNRQYGTRYHELHPGIANTLAVQQEIIQEINNVLVRVIVLTSRPSFEDNDSKIDSGVDLLDNYIAINFELTEQIGEYEVWIRRQ